MQIISISSKSLRVSLIALGARIHDIQFNDTSVALHYDDSEQYHHDPFYLGASVGPIANRIANARLNVEGRIFSLPNNEGENCLHSGGLGFDKHMWELIEHTENQATFKLQYDLADIGMVGLLTVHAIYRIEEDKLHIEYHSQCTNTTYINPTNHVYLNLSGHSAAGHNNAIDDHEFECFGINYVNVDQHNIPTGKTTPFSEPLSYVLNATNPNNTDSHDSHKNGWDHHFNIRQDDTEPAENQLMARARSLSSHISLDVFSNAPGYQFYTGRFLENPFCSFGGFCIETQYAPDAINQTDFVSPLLEAGETHLHSTVLAFSKKVGNQ